MEHLQPYRLLLQLPLEELGRKICRKCQQRSTLPENTGVSFRSPPFQPPPSALNSPSQPATCPGSGRLSTCPELVQTSKRRTSYPLLSWCRPNLRRYVMAWGKLGPAGAEERNRKSWRREEGRGEGMGHLAALRSSFCLLSFSALSRLTAKAV